MVFPLTHKFIYLFLKVIEWLHKQLNEKTLMGTGSFDPVFARSPPQLVFSNLLEIYAVFNEIQCRRKQHKRRLFRYAAII